MKRQLKLIGNVSAQVRQLVRSARKRVGERRLKWRSRGIENVQVRKAIRLATPQEIGARVDARRELARDSGRPISRAWNCQRAAVQSECCDRRRSGKIAASVKVLGHGPLIEAASKHAKTD